MKSDFSIHIIMPDKQLANLVINFTIAHTIPRSKHAQRRQQPIVLEYADLDIIWIGPTFE